MALAAFRLVAVTVPAAKLPEPSRFTIAFAVSALVGVTFHAMLSVPLLVTGEPVTVKSVEGAASPTLFTVPAPGNVCPVANVNSPLLLTFSPVSAGVAVPVAYSRFSVPEAVVVLLFTGSACNWNVCATAVEVPLLNTDATKLCGRDLKPARAVAVPVAGKLSVPPTLIAVVPACVNSEF